MAGNSTSQRKRGVQASRARLARALTDAGLRTQAALAERMADLEGLEAAPKDVVNRVFRERPVELTTLERVARALGVEAHTLYKTADEANVSPPATGVSPSSSPTSPDVSPSRRTLVLAGVLVVVVAAGVGLLLTRWPTPTGAGGVPGVATPGVAAPGVATPGVATPGGPVALGLGAPAVVVLDLDGDDSGLTERLREALGRDFSVANDTSAVLTRSLSRTDIAERLRADAVIDGELLQVGRLTALRVYLLRDGVRRQIWAESWPAAELPDRGSDIVHRVTLAVGGAMGRAEPETGHFPLAPVQDNYLEGQRHLDAPSNELNVRRAQTRFEAALRQDSNYARAHAGLCQSLLEEHWMDNEEVALKDAARTCGRALQLAPDDPVVAAAHAHFLRRTGRNDEAIALYRKVTDAHPKDADALTGLASAQLHEYRRTGDRAFIEAARSSARQAADVDPMVWKPLFTLATIEWFEGNVNGAIEASEEAISRNENEYVLANLGTFYLCGGALEKARDAYLRALELNPQSYVGDEFLGMAYYVLGDFRRSAELRQKAIDAIAAGEPEIHEMWGNLGDSYRRSGASERAVEAYTRAAEIAERDHLRGTAPIADQAARAYYYTVLNELRPAAVPASVLQGIDDDIDRIAGEIESAGAQRRMAETYLLRGELDKAMDALDKGTRTCPGYARWPGLESLRDDES